MFNFDIIVRKRGDSKVSVAYLIECNGQLYGDYISGVNEEPDSIQKAISIVASLAMGEIVFDDIIGSHSITSKEWLAQHEDYEPGIFGIEEETDGPPEISHVGYTDEAMGYEK